MSGIWIIFLSIIGIVAFVIIGYWIYYRFSINKSLHSDKPKKRIPPKDVIITSLAILLMISIGFSIFKIAEDFSKPDEKYFFTYSYEDTRGTAFDALFDDKDLAQQSGYYLYVWQENGFEVCELSSGKYMTAPNLMPTTLIRVRYTEDLPTLAEGENLDYNFGFLYRGAEKQDEKYIGVSAEGAYRQKYIVIDLHGWYDIKITAELRVVSDKTNLPAAFSKMLFEMNIKQI